MKLTKVHIGLLTNLAEGDVKNEHMTLYFSKEVQAKTVIKRMHAINALLPVDLSMMFNQKLMTFKAWGGNIILTPETNAFRWDKPYTAILGGVERPHITLAINPNATDREELAAENLNWENGLVIGECHAGFKIDGVMYYFTVEELQDEADRSQIGLI